MRIFHETHRLLPVATMSSVGVVSAPSSPTAAGWIINFKDAFSIDKFCTHNILNSAVLWKSTSEVQIAGWDEVEGHLNDWRSVGQPINNILCRLKCTLVAYTHQVPRGSRLLPSVVSSGGIQRWQQTSDDALNVTVELQAQEHIGVVVGILFLADIKVEI